MNGIAIDRSGHAYVVGLTASADFPTVKAFQPKRSSDCEGCSDVFFTKLSPEGDSLVFSSFLGGEGNDEGRGIALDAAENIYLTGTTGGNFPTKNPIQASSRGGSTCSAWLYRSAGSGCDYEAFVTKVAAGGASLIYSTYLGGSSGDGGNGIAVDASGNAYVVGETTSSDFPTAHAAQPAFGGGTCREFETSRNCMDAFVVKLSDPSSSPPGSDLSLSLTADPNRPKSGNQFNYSITVANAGPSAATGVTVTDQLPEGVDLISAISSSGSCAAVSGKISCNLGDLANQGSASIRLIVSSKAAGTIRNSATAATTAIDPNPKNNRAEIITEIAAKTAASADVGIALSASAPSVSVGSPLTYTLTVSNAGPAAAEGVVVSNLIPEGMTLVSAAPSSGSCSANGTILCPLGTVPSGGSATVTLVVTPTTPGEISDSASVTASTADPVASNNIAAVTASVTDPASGPTVTPAAGGDSGGGGGAEVPPAGDGGGGGGCTVSNGGGSDASLAALLGAALFILFRRKKSPSLPG